MRTTRSLRKPGWRVPVVYARELAVSPHGPDLARKFSRRRSEKAVGLSDLPRLSPLRFALYSLTAIFCLSLWGCSSNSNPSSSAAATTTPGALATVTISATPLAIATNATDQFSASGADSSGNAITSLTVTWTSSAPNVATIDSNSGLATAVAPGVTAITASSSGVTSNTLFLTVTAPLKGQYAFLLQGFDDATGQQVAMIGSFSADGTTVISGGLEDINGPNGFSEVTFSGTYTTDSSPPDNRGRIVITNSAGAFSEFTFVAGSLSGGVPTAGKIIEFDDSTGTQTARAAGVFYLQNTSDFALSSIAGPYALQFFGQHTTVGSWFVSTGAFSADGNGKFTSGELDTNAPPTLPSSTPQSFTATLTTNSTITTNTSTNGQFLLSFSTGVSGVLYLISPSQALFMETDVESSIGLEAGQILAQTSAPFTSASLNAAAVEHEEGLGSTSGQPLAAIGLINFSTNPISVSRDVDDSGTTTTQSPSLTFQAPVTANGRVVLMNSATATEFAVVYLVAPNEGFIMSASASATMGFFQPQAGGPFSAASVSGSYFGGTPPPSVQSIILMQSMSNPAVGIPVVNDAELSSPGNGFVSITLDISLNAGSGRSLLQGQQGGHGLTVAANGRATDGQGDIYYVIGPSSFLMLIPNAAGSPPVPATPVIDIYQQ